MSLLTSHLKVWSALLLNYPSSVHSTIFSGNLLPFCWYYSAPNIQFVNINAFAEIIEHYQVPIICYLYRLTGDYEVAQDLVGVFTNPLIVFPGGWGDTLPEWLKNAIILERLEQKGFSKKQKMSLIIWTSTGTWQLAY